MFINQTPSPFSDMKCSVKKRICVRPGMLVAMWRPIMGYHNTKDKILSFEYTNIMLLLIPGYSFASIAYIYTSIWTIKNSLGLHWLVITLNQNIWEIQCVILNVSKHTAVCVWTSHDLRSILQVIIRVAILSSEMSRPHVHIPPIQNGLGERSKYIISNNLEK
jgi:hypothetical protein